MARHGRQPSRAVLPLLLALLYPHASLGSPLREAVEEVVGGEPVLPACAAMPDAMPRLGPGIVYIKTHKTASTTMQGVVMRIALNRGLRTFLTKKAHTVDVTGFRTRQVMPLGHLVSFGDGGGDAQVWLNHVYYDPVLFDLVPSANHTLMTVVRHPATTFVSAFNAFKLKQVVGKDVDTIVSQLKHDPVTAATLVHDKLNKPRDRHLDLLSLEGEASHFGGPLKHHALYGKAYMAGVERLRSQACGGKWFMVVAERLHESLLVMAKMYGLSADDMLYYSHRVASSSSSHSLSDDDKEVVGAAQPVSMALYDMANRLLDRYVELYGAEQMREDILDFEADLAEVREVCSKELQDRTDINVRTSNLKKGRSPDARVSAWRNDPVKRRQQCEALAAANFDKN